MKNKSLFSRLWAGEISLPMTYWVYLTLPNLIFGIVIRGVASNMTRGSYTLSVIIYLVWLIFMLVSVWNSSNNYQGSTVWRILAKCMVVLGGLMALGNLGILLEVWR